MSSGNHAFEKNLYLLTLAYRWCKLCKCVWLVTASVHGKCRFVWFVIFQHSFVIKSFRHHFLNNILVTHWQRWCFFVHLVFQFLHEFDSAALLAPIRISPSTSHFQSIATNRHLGSQDELFGARNHLKFSFSPYFILLLDLLCVTLLSRCWLFRVHTPSRGELQEAFLFGVIEFVDSEALVLPYFSALIAATVK